MILFIEGLPGSGKTTFARRLQKHYESLGKTVSMYNEGDLHPIDFAWCSITTKQEFEELITKYSKYKESILHQTKEFNEYYITAYTRIKDVQKEDVEIYSDFQKKEIYRQDDFEQFKKWHHKSWSSFNESTDITIFECIFLQNHINELILKYNLPLEKQIQYFKELIANLQGESKIFYIKQNNVDKTISRIIEERRGEGHFRDWIDLMLEYLEQTKYGKELGYVGMDGGMQYLKDRQHIELEILKHLDADVHVFELEEDYDKVFEEMKQK